MKTSLFVIVGALMLSPAAHAENPLMAVVVEQIKQSPGVRHEGDTYVLDLVPAGSEGHKAVATYTAAHDEEPDSLLIETTISLPIESGAIIVCTSTMVDRGLIGSIGPRDGSTSCTGGLGLAGIVGASRPADYTAIVGSMYFAGMIAHSVEKLQGEEPAAQETAPEPVPPDPEPATEYTLGIES
jgi:hypothetical protein